MELPSYEEAIKQSVVSQPRIKENAKILWNRRKGLFSSLLMLKEILGVKFHAYWEKVSLVQFHPCIVIKRYRWMTPLQPSVTKWPSTLPGTTQRTTECHRPTNTCLSHCSYLVLPCFPFFLGCLNWAFGSINHSYSLAWCIALHLQASPVSGPWWIYPRQPTI